MIGGWGYFKYRNGGRGCSFYKKGENERNDGGSLKDVGQAPSAHHGNLAEVYSEHCQDRALCESNHYHKKLHCRCLTGF